MFCRRTLLKTAACGFGNLAFSGMAAASGPSPLAIKSPHFAPRVKRVIFLFMQGGPGHTDTFDYKPHLQRNHGKTVTVRDARTLAKTGKTMEGRLVASPWSFSQYGQSGHWVSDLFPNIAKHVDDLCFLHGMHTEGVAHGPSTLFLHTGSTNLVRPSMGSWVLYGLGSENQNLPGFVTITPTVNMGGPRNYSNAFLPSGYQGTPIGRAGTPASDLGFRNITNEILQGQQQRQRLQLLRQLNAHQTHRRPGDDELDGVIDSYELAFRMQTQAAGVFDTKAESDSTLKMYGIGEDATDQYGRQCLMARQLCESGVRFVQVTYGDSSNNPAWDQHANLPKHADHALATDKPVAGLLQDLKQRGLLEDTLVWWGGEFGRTPYAEGTGRDHNPDGFTSFLAGGGVKKGFSYGETDELGHFAVRHKVHMHDLHATMLHLLGLDHERLTYRRAGRDFRLTDVAGRVIHDILT